MVHTKTPEANLIFICVLMGPRRSDYSLLPYIPCRPAYSDKKNWADNKPVKSLNLCTQVHEDGKHKEVNITKCNPNGCLFVNLLFLSC